MQTQLNLEALEAKENASATVLAGGALFVDVTGAQTHTVSIDQPNANTIQVNVDGAIKSFQASKVNSITVRGADNGVNIIQNNTPIDSVLLGGNKADTIFGGTGNNYIDPGKGKDVVYAIVGTNTVNAKDGDTDIVRVNSGATLISDKADQTQTFFAPGRTPGTPFIGLDNTLKDGVLYITPSNNGSSVSINPGKNGAISVTYDLGDGKGVKTKSFTGVKSIAYFGGSGDDVYVNNTTLVDTVYGAAGNDVIVGGLGDYSLLKGSSGNDSIVARAKKNDVSGNAGTDLIVDLNNKKGDILRTDAADIVISAATPIILKV